MVVLRLKEFIDFKGIKVSVFEKAIGMSNASFGKSLKNGGSIGSDKLENILSVYPDLNPTWLLTGEGNMLADEQPGDNDPKKNEGDNINNSLLQIIQEKDKLLLAQAEEIGRLKAELKRMLSNADNATSDLSARAV